MTAHVEKEGKLPARAHGPGRRSRGARLGIHVAAAMSLILACAGSAQAQSGRPAKPEPRPRPGVEPVPDTESTPDAEPILDAPSAGTPAPPGTSAPASTGAPAKRPGPAALSPLARISAEAVAAAGSNAPWSNGVALARRQTARDIFVAANDLARKRFFASAAAQYRQALEIWPHPAFFYNLAMVQLQLEQPIEAHANLERAVEHGSEPLDGRYIQARQQLALLESELSPIVVGCAEPGAQVMLDGKLLFRGPGRHRGIVRPGTHQLVATRRGLTPVVEQIVVAPGEKGRFVLTFEYPELAVSRRPWPAWRSQAVVGAGAALLLAAGILDWHSSRMFDEYDRMVEDGCPRGCTDEMSPPGLDDLKSRARREQHVATATYVASGAALATGMILMYFGRERTTRRRMRPPPEPEAETGAVSGAFMPLVSPGSMGVSAMLRF